MTTRLTTAIAAGALTIGLLMGAAGAIVVGNATDTPDLRHEHMGWMVEGAGRAGMGTMMDMMGGSMMGEPGEMGPRSSQHDAHHRNMNR